MDSLATAPARSVGGHDRAWDPTVVSDIFSLDYTLAVLMTDAAGRVIHLEHRVKPDPALAEICETMLGAIRQGGARLNIGEPTITASLHASGTLVSAHSRAGEISLFVLARTSSNLGQLFNHVRRVFAWEST